MKGNTDITIAEFLETTNLAVVDGDVAVELGVDPDMPYDQFQRWLQWGERVDRMIAAGWADTGQFSDTLTYIQSGEQ